MPRREPAPPPVNIRHEESIKKDVRKDDKGADSPKKEDPQKFKKEKKPKKKKDTDVDKLMKAAKEHETHGLTKDKKSAALFLDCDENYRGVSDFLKTSSNFKIDALDRVSINWVNKLDNRDKKWASSLFNGKNLKSINTIYLNGHTESGLKDINEYASTLFKTATKQIYLDSFNFDQDDLIQIFSTCVKTQELCLVNCSIEKLDEDFKLNPKQVFAMKSLDMYWTLSKDRDDLIDEEKANIFFKAIAKSKLKTSLKQIHACTNDFKAKELEAVIKAAGLKARVVWDTKQPKPKH